MFFEIIDFLSLSLSFSLLNLSRIFFNILLVEENLWKIEETESKYTKNGDVKKNIFT